MIKSGDRVTLITMGMRNRASVINPDTYGDGTAATLVYAYDATPYLATPTMSTRTVVVDYARILIGKGE